MAAASRLRAAHFAVAAAFVALGAVDGVWASRLPALKARLGLDSGELGLVILAVSLTATVLLPLSGWFTAHFGSRGPTGVGMVIAACGLTLAAFAPTFPALVASGCVIGAGLSVLDVAANAHGVAVEQRMGRPLLSALHGAWSFGLLGGSAVGALSAAAGIGPRVIFPAVAAAIAVAAVPIVPRLLPGSEDAAVDTARFALPRGPLALPALLTFCCVFVETATMNWAAVFLAGPVGTSAAVAAAGVVSFALAMAFARLVSDRIAARWGVARLAQGGGALTVVGVLLAVLPQEPVPALIGFALVGAGAAAIVPALFRIGATTPGISSGAGIAAVATTGYTGGVLNGPVIGFLGRAVGLAGAFSVVGIAGVVMVVLGPRLQR